LWIYTGGIFVITAWLYVRARRRGFRPIVALLPAFLTAELVYPLLFPYYYGASLHMLPAMIQIVDLGGPLLVSGVVAAVNAALFEVAFARWRRQPMPRAAPIAAIAAVLATLAYGAFRIADVDGRAARAPEITVGIVQANMGLMEKRENPAEGLRRHLYLSEELQDEVQPDLLVWPESGLGYVLPDDLRNVRRFMPRIHTPLLFGGLAIRRSADRARHYNTAYMVDAEGNIVGTYDKTHLLAFGEYLPFGEAYPELYEMSPRSGRFTPGDHVRPVPFGRYRISTLICYEDVIPRFVRAAVNEGDPHLLVNVTNDSWFGDTTEPWIHLALAKLRAVEHHRYLVRATNSGVSAIVDPVGRIVVQSRTFVTESIHGRARLMRSWNLYQTLGDWPGWVALLAAIAFGFVLPRKNRTVKTQVNSKT